MEYDAVMMSVGDLELCDQARVRARNGEVLAAPRDASCYSSPSNGAGAHAGGKYHAADVNGAARCSGAPLVLELARLPGQLDEILLCRRAACVREWRRAVS